MKQLHLLLVNYLNLFSAPTNVIQLHAIDTWNKTQTFLGDTILKDLMPNKIKTVIMNRITDSH